MDICYQIRIPTAIKAITRERRLVRSHKDPSDPMGKATFDEYEDLGWFISFEGSWEKLGVGMHEPQLKAGKCDIIIQQSARKEL